MASAVAGNVSVASVGFIGYDVLPGLAVINRLPVDVFVKTARKQLFPYLPLFQRHQPSR